MQAVHNEKADETLTLEEVTKNQGSIYTFITPYDYTADGDYICNENDASIKHNSKREYYSEHEYFIKLVRNGQTHIISLRRMRGHLQVYTSGSYVNSESFKGYIITPDGIAEEALEMVVALEKWNKTYQQRILEHTSK